MFGLLLAATLIPAPLDDPRGDFPDVSLLDLRDFEAKGLGPQQAKTAWRLANVHIEAMGPRIEAANDGGYVLWFSDADWCRSCWSALDNAFGTYSNDRHYRLSELDRLRLLLGDERYHGRDMPTPSPGWLFKPTDLWVKTARP